MIHIPVLCPHCHSDQVIKGGKTHAWGAYTRHLDPDEHQPGKRNTQQIERKHLTLRTRIKRLTRKTICFRVMIKSCG